MEADLTERLAIAAADAARRFRAAIEDGAANLNGVMVEMEIANSGATLDVTAHLSWKSVLRQAKAGTRDNR